MNKIYKVVWNKARNCYVVASEFAKNHQTGSSRIKAASVAAVMAATMLTIGTGVIYAANVTDTGVKESKETILFANKQDITTKLNNPNLEHYHPNSWVHGHTAECGELTYNTTLTIGDINKVVDALVANDGSLYDQDIKNVTMKDGTISLMRNDGSPVTDKIALTGNGGTNGQDTSVTVKVGDQSQTFQTGSVVTANTDTSGKATGLTINGKSYDIKDTTYSAGDNVTIDNNKISVDLSKYAKSDDVAVVYQNNDKNKSLHSTNAGTVDSSSIALGKEATTGKWSVALGDQTKATGEHSTAIGVEAEATALDSIAIGGGTKATGGDSIAIGNDTTANSQYSVAIGDDIHSTGYSATAVGQQAHATGNSSTALGAMTNVDGDWNYQHPGEWRNSGTMSTAIGYGSGSWGDYSTAIGGGYATAEGKFATAIGTSSQATAENAVALGGAAKANVYGGVALGTSSVADRAAGEKGAFAPTQINEIAQSTWISTQGAVSVGDTEKNITRQITHVAAGSEDTDAVNVAQLKQVNSKADSATETANKGWNLTTAHGGTTTVKPGDTVDFSPEDTNLTVTNEGTNVKIGLNKDLTGIESMTNGSSSIRMGNGGTVTINKVTIDQSGKISGVAAGRIAADSTDAINGSQLHAVQQEAGKHTKVVNGSNITVEETDQDGQKTYKVGLNKDLLLGDIPGKNVSISGTNGTIETTGFIATEDKIYADKGAKLADVNVTGDTISNDKSSVKLDKDGTVTINNKVTVDQNGKVSGVAAGDISDTSTDAVNGSQLYNETRVAKDGNFVKKSNTAGENLSALDNQVTANTESIYHMNGRISDLDNRVNKVGAGAAALAALHPLDFDPDAKWDFAAGYGNYRGANAAAVGAYYRPNEDTMFSVGGTFGNGENMVNAGVSFKLGSGSSHVSTSRVAMAKEIKELRGELEAMKSAMLDANAGKKIDTSKLQLFPDVPQNHWAYEYVAQLAGNGMIEGYPDGNFAGDRPMTRYEFAAILYRAMTKGAVLSDKILSEFSHELEYFTVDTIAKDKAGNPTIQRVRTVKENKNK